MVFFSWTVYIFVPCFWVLYCSANDSTVFNLCFEEACYHKSDTEMSWVEAVNYCVEVDAVLTSIHSAEENAYINDYVRNSTTDDCWIGLNDIDNEGDWQWVDGTTFDYSYWAPYEPNNEDENEHTVQIWRYGKWNDYISTIDNYAICKRLPKPTLAPTAQPTFSPTVTLWPTTLPTFSPSVFPTLPTYTPTPKPSYETPSQKKDFSLAFGMSELVILVSASIIIICCVVVICVLFCWIMPRSRLEAYSKGLSEAKDRTFGEADMPTGERGFKELEMVLPLDTGGET